MKRITNFIIILLSIFTITSCEDELNVENINDLKVDSKKTESAEDIINKANNLYKSWWIANYHISKSDSPALALLTMADAGSCSWGNWGMFDLSSEPRLPFDNSVSYQSASINSQYFKALMGTINNCNTVILAGKGEYLNENTNKIVDLGNKREQALALSYFVRGLSFGYLSAFYDKVFIITEETDLTIDPVELAKSSLADYKKALNQAISDLEKAIEISSNSSFTLPESVFTTVKNNNDLKELSNSFAARLMIYNSRNKSENSEVDWSKVLNYAQNGIKSDFFVNTKKADGNWGANDFINTYNVYAGYWAKVDMRLINLMDPSMDATFPSSGDFKDLKNEGKADSNDMRLESDFSYSPKNNFRPERGYYHFGTYSTKKHKFTDYYLNDVESIQMYKYENDLMIAEAQANLGNTSAAVSILNNGNRKIKGSIDTSTSISKDELLNIISYERQIDLFLSTFGIEFYEMRRHDLLQKGTPLHFPIPGDQLNTVLIPIYTFGGTLGEAGKDYSNGGWK